MAFPYHLENTHVPSVHFGKKIKKRIKPHISQLRSDVTVSILSYIFSQEFCYECYFTRLKSYWVYVGFLSYMVLCSALYDEHYTLSIMPSPHH